MDVSKATLDAALLLDVAAPKARHKVCPNTSEGHEQLLLWLHINGASTVHATLEATGTYAQGVSLWLHEARHKVSLVNPDQVRAFGQSQFKRTKTDKADALLIARFCALHQPALWNPPAPELSELQALVRRVEALDEMKRMEENRLDADVSCDLVRASLVDHIHYLQSQIEATRRQIGEHIQAHEELREQARLLCSIPGLGCVTAAVLLSEIDDLSHFLKRAPGRGFCRACAAPARIGFQCAGQTAPLQSRLAALAKVPLLPGDDRAALEPAHQGVGRAALGAGQAQDADTGRGDEKAASSHLWSSQIGTTLRCQL